MRPAVLVLLAICACFVVASGACSEPRLCSEAECISCDAICCDASTTELTDMLPDACGGEVVDSCAQHGGVLQSFRGSEPFMETASTCGDTATTCIVRCCGGGIFASHPATVAECIAFSGNAKLCRDEGGPIQILYAEQIVYPGSNDPIAECPTSRDCVVLCDGAVKTQASDFRESSCIFFHKGDCPAGTMKTEVEYDGKSVFTSP